MTLPVLHSLSRRTVLGGLSVLALGRGAGAQSGRELVVSQFSETRDLSSIDPMRSLDYTIPGSLLFDPLVGRDASDRLVPGLATAWERAAPDLWRFTIRDDARFHDGTPVTAADTAATINAALHPETRGSLRLQLAPVVTAEAPDARTLLLRTGVPTGILPRIVAGMFTLPARQLADAAGPWRTQPMGSGPWRIEEWRPGERIVFTATGVHWQHPRPAFARIVVKVVPEASTRVADLLSGGAQIAADVPPALAPRVSRAPGVRLVTQAGVRTQYVSFSFKPPFDDARVRRAVYHGIDRAALAETVWGDLAETATGAVPRPYGGYVEAFPLSDYDPERSRALLREAGAAAPLAVELAVPPTETQGAQVIQAQLARAGFAVTIRPLESIAQAADPGRVARDERGSMWMITALDNLQHDATRPYAAFYGQATFLSQMGYRPDPRLGPLVAAYASADGEARTAASRAVMEVAKADAAAVYLAYPKMAFGVASGVEMPATGLGRLDFTALRPVG